MKIIPNNLKYIILLLITTLLNTYINDHQNKQPTSNNKTPQINPHILTNQKQLISLRNDLTTLNNQLNLTKTKQITQTTIYYSSYLTKKYKIMHPTTLHNILIHIKLKNHNLYYH